MKTSGRCDISANAVECGFNITDISIHEGEIHISGENANEFAKIEFTTPVFWTFSFGCDHSYWKVPLRAGGIRILIYSIFIKSADWSISIDLSKETIDELRRQGKLALIK